MAENKKPVSASKGDSAREKRLEEALRANLARRKAQAKAIALNNEERARAFKAAGGEES